MINRQSYKRNDEQEEDIYDDEVIRDSLLNDDSADLMVVNLTNTIMTKPQTTEEEEEGATDR